MKEHEKQTMHKAVHGASILAEFSDHLVTVSEQMDKLDTNGYRPGGTNDTSRTHIKPTEAQRVFAETISEQTGYMSREETFAACVQFAMSRPKEFTTWLQLARIGTNVPQKNQEDTTESSESTEDVPQATKNGTDESSQSVQSESSSEQMDKDDPDVSMEEIAGGFNPEADEYPGEEEHH